MRQNVFVIILAVVIGAFPISACVFGVIHGRGKGVIVISFVVDAVVEVSKDVNYLSVTRSHYCVLCLLSCYAAVGIGLAVGESKSKIREIFSVESAFPLLQTHCGFVRYLVFRGQGYGCQLVIAHRFGNDVSSRRKAYGTYSFLVVENNFYFFKRLRVGFSESDFDVLGNISVLFFVVDKIVVFIGDVDIVTEIVVESGGKVFFNPGFFSGFSVNKRFIVFDFVNVFGSRCGY